MDWKTFALHEGHEKDDNFQLAIITFFFLISRPCFITKNPSCVTDA